MKPKTTTTSMPLKVPIAGRSSRTRRRYRTQSAMVSSVPVMATHDARMVGRVVEVGVDMSGPHRLEGSERELAQVAAHPSQGRRVPVLQDPHPGIQAALGEVLGQGGA